VITITGANGFGVKRELDGLVAAFLREHDAMGLERVDGEEAEFDRLSEALTSLPFLATKKLVVVRNGSSNKQFVEKAKELLEGLPETTELVLVEAKLDKRGAYYKMLKKDTDFREFAELGVFGVILGNRSADELGLLAQQLHPLDAQDRQQNSAEAGLLASLETYLRHNGQIESTAAELGIHRHTLRNRLAKISELTHSDLRTADARAELWLAFKARELLALGAAAPTHPQQPRLLR